MALSIASVLAPHAAALGVAVAIDLAIGDPEYPAHPVRGIGRSLQIIEGWLRRIGADSYAGGIILFVALAVTWVGVLSGLVLWLASLWSWLGWAAHLFLLYSFLALGDLLRHGWAIERAVRRGDLQEARKDVSRLVGRDTEPMDGAACRRAAVESLSENLTDGLTSAVFWYVLGGLPLLILFKVVSTMDSMVGYKTPAYLRFGWCGARLDDAMNFVPARLTWLLIAGVAAMLPRCSGRKALRVGVQQHAVLPGPNSGWSEAATAGAIGRRLVGPIWMKGELVTDLWIGDSRDPPLETQGDYTTASRLVAAVGLSAAVAGCVILAVF